MGSINKLSGYGAVGSARCLERRGRRFKSYCPDHINNSIPSSSTVERRPEEPSVPSSTLGVETISGSAQVGEWGLSVKQLALRLSRFESYLPDHILL